MRTGQGFQRVVILLLVELHTGQMQTRQILDGGFLAVGQRPFQLALRTLEVLARNVELGQQHRGTRCVCRVLVLVDQHRSGFACGLGIIRSQRLRELFVHGGRFQALRHRVVLPVAPAGSGCNHHRQAGHHQAAPAFPPGFQFVQPFLLVEIVGCHRAMPF